MEQTLQQLAGILRKAIPTICLLIILHFYLKAVLFKPLEKVLAERDRLTSGARKLAEQSHAEAERRAAEYESKFRDARAVVYREQEETRRGWLDDQAKQAGAAHERTAQSVRASKDRIAADAETARKGLDTTSAALADRIAQTLLARRTR